MMAKCRICGEQLAATRACTALDTRASLPTRTTVNGRLSLLYGVCVGVGVCVCVCVCGCVWVWVCVCVWVVWERNVFTCMSVIHVELRII